ncbi:M12 family metallopeptidase [Pricia sp.]|uniref:M12 family metallopeptidase n=1 Tax=Pricia sp. TaxID=2268138 RepID=UPI0035948985
MKHLRSSYRLVLITLVCTLYLVSCTKDAIETYTVESVDETPINEESQDKDFITKYFMGTEVKVKLEDDGTYSLAGSDTRLFENQLSDSPGAYEANPVPDDGITGLALVGGVRKWSNNTVVYVINGLNSQVRSELQKSFNEWSGKTNIRFKERTNESTYVTISSSGSNSNSGVATLGSNGSRSFIRLGTRATAVVIIHEIGHTLGYIHEQNRSHRDNYIIINFDNIQDDAKDQFFKSSSASLVTNPLDLNSTMMYGSYTFSKNGRPTITDLNGNTYPQSQARISSGDIAGTNAVYPGGGGDGGGDACSDSKQWSSSTQYKVGDRVIYQGRLYERDFSRWNFIKNCG